MSNIFGGANENSLYVPMSDLEQEAISRIVEDHGLEVRIRGWGKSAPVVVYGDMRVSLFIEMTFSAPEFPVPVYYFELELWTRTGIKLFPVVGSDKQSVAYGGNPLQVSAGVQIQLVWDISMHSMSPELVKKIVPGATGLTSRVIDKTTGNLTLTGNMKLSEDHLRYLHYLRSQEIYQRQYTEMQRASAQKMEDKSLASGEVVKLDIPEE
jgi:hypothetical protein